jgi:hypothetical protein
VRLSRDRLDSGERGVRYGVPVTREERAVFDEMRTAEDLREAAVALEMAAAAEITSIKRVSDYTEKRPGWGGVPQVRAALAVASEDSRSPNETRMRLIWQLDAGFPRPLVNQPVWDLHGNLLGVADILDPVAGVVGEFDGADHRTARRHSRDVDREGRLRDCGLELFRVTGPDLRDRQLVVRRMRAARSRALWLPEGRRTWTIEAPRGWQEEPCLDTRLEEREWRGAFYAQCEREGFPDIRDLIGP